MVDYTTKDSGGSGIGLWIAAGAIVLVLLYAIFAGGSGTTTQDPASLAVEPAADAALGTSGAESTPTITE